jgi:hypothetical protein
MHLTHHHVPKQYLSYDPILQIGALRQQALKNSVPPADMPASSSPLAALAEGLKRF